jgi:hypothetical protein
MEWIKTTDRLPDSDGTYIVWDTHHYMVRTLVFNHENECWDDEWGDDYECNIERVSHWMPIPDRPKL